MSTMKAQSTLVAIAQDERMSGRPVYEPPAVVSYSDEYILEMLGPARTLYVCDPADPTCP